MKSTVYFHSQNNITIKITRLKQLIQNEITVFIVTHFTECGYMCIRYGELCFDKYFIKMFEHSRFIILLNIELC